MGTIYRLACAAALSAAIASPAMADEPLVTFKIMSTATALKSAEAALADCRKRGYQVTVAVVDRFGITQVLLRDRFAGPHTPETARRKAWTAVSFRTDTVALAELTQPGKEASGIRNVDQVLAVGGGITVEAAGSIVGGIGVSGGPSGTADAACAEAGVEAITDELSF